MKVKKTVAALCLAAIMATSVGAAAYPAKETPPAHSEGKWEHGFASTYSYSYFKSYICRWSWSYAQVGAGGVDTYAKYPQTAKSETECGVDWGHREYWDHWGDFYY